MATYADFSEYVYRPTDEPMVNIGWLGRELTFPQGPVAADVVKGLLILAINQENLMRGVHDCDFCDEVSPIEMASERSDKPIWLGMGELHVTGSDGTKYSAPSLVIHYIVAHNYRPPAVFQDAVLGKSGLQ